MTKKRVHNIKATGGRLTAGMRLPSLVYISQRLIHVDGEDQEIRAARPHEYRNNGGVKFDGSNNLCQLSFCSQRYTAPIHRF